MPDFFKEYVSGNIYDVSSDVFTNPKNLAGVSNIKPEGEDTVEFFSAKYYDLSANIYRINLPHSSKDIDSDAEIRFVVNSVDVALDDLTLLVFGLKDGRLQYFDGWTITNVKGLTEEGWDLIVVVVNSKYNKEDWDKTSDIELKVELVTTQEITDDSVSRFLEVLPANFSGNCTCYQNPNRLYCDFKTWRDYPHIDWGVPSIMWSVSVDVYMYNSADIKPIWEARLRYARQYGGPEYTISDDRIVKGPYIFTHYEDIKTYSQDVQLLHKNSIIEIRVSWAPTKQECESVVDAVEGVAKRIIDENLLTEQMP